MFPRVIPIPCSVGPDRMMVLLCYTLLCFCNGLITVYGLPTEHWGEGRLYQENVRSVSGISVPPDSVVPTLHRLALKFKVLPNICYR